MTNVFEMHNKLGGPGFWVRRENWCQYTCARIIRMGKPTKPAPYYGNPSVLADIFSNGVLKDELVQLPAPGTGAYAMIPTPEWAIGMELRPLDDPAIDPVFLALDKKRRKAFRPPKDTSHIEKVWLRVIYDRKDEAKALGAKWSPEEKKWWLPADNTDAIEKARDRRFLDRSGVEE